MTTLAHTASHERNLKQGVAQKVGRMYRPPVVTLLATGRENSEKQKALSAKDTISGVFFGLKYRSMAVVCEQASAWLGSFCPSILTSHTVATQSREKDRGGSSAKGALPMQFSRTQNPSATSGKAAAHRAMAIAALMADSSLSVRLKRYNHHVEIARNLEAIGGAL